MSPVEFKKRSCPPVEFKGQGPYRAEYFSLQHYILMDWSLITGSGGGRGGGLKMGSDTKKWLRNYLCRPPPPLKIVVTLKARSHIETQLNSTVELSWVSVSFDM